MKFLAYPIAHWSADAVLYGKKCKKVLDCFCAGLLQVRPARRVGGGRDERGGVEKRLLPAGRKVSHLRRGLLRCLQRIVSPDVYSATSLLVGAVPESLTATFFF